MSTVCYDCTRMENRKSTNWELGQSSECVLFISIRLAVVVLYTNPAQLTLIN